VAKKPGDALQAENLSKNNKVLKSLREGKATRGNGVRLASLRAPIPETFTRDHIQTSKYSPSPPSLEKEHKTVNRYHTRDRHPIRPSPSELKD
jgi:hypothetical protein